ncbi:hypothetical protein NQ317_012302 [Molorchus minor]|uniref:Uncharacterized protein n=1 Tax=Molorchus minor TaxID=1323400 RepID=A0ABQ9J1M3_9CUCU|nr:hypothetical protein NQ317_012302 [Molorchus minor]
MYQKRKEYLEGMLEAEAAKLSNQARFIMEKCSGIDELVKRGYAPDPVKEWKHRCKDEEEEEEAAEEEESQEEEGQSSKNKTCGCSNTILQEYHDFYKNLPVSQNRNQDESSDDEINLQAIREKILSKKMKNKEDVHF